MVREPPTPSTLETEEVRPAPAEPGTLGLVVSCAAGVTVVPLRPGVDAVVGRSSDCDVVVEDPSVSRHHAKLSLSPRPTLEDLGSRNGTTLLGARLARGERLPLPLGTAFELGAATLVIQSAPSLWRAPGAPRRRPVSRASSGPIVCDPATRSIYALLEVIGSTNLSVLVLGETGVGKELYAEAVHLRSTRAGGPLLRLNCAALPESTLEAELFGYERGAFTGAIQAKPGLLESAAGGTVFLDEMGEMPMATQARLLRVLDGGEILRLGSVKPRRVDVRFVAATNRDPRRAIATGTLREDLYYRLAGFTVTVPPLRARKADIGPIASSFAARASGDRTSLTLAAVQALEGYAWPGNVRELKHVIERATALCRRDTLDVSDLLAAAPEVFGPDPSEEREPGRSPAVAPAPGVGGDDDGDPLARTQDGAPAPSGVPLRREMESIERARIVEALERCGSNQTHAARLLGVSRRTLITKMIGYKIPRGPRAR